MSDIFAGLNRGAADPDKITMDTFSSGDNNSSRKGRYNKFSDALAAAAGYKQKARAEAEAQRMWMMMMKRIHRVLKFHLMHL